MHIEIYGDNHRTEWDTFVRHSKNGTFLFVRDYMEYHRDRFDDHSLIVRADDGRAIALLPANRLGESIVSHGGLTYGGFITNSTMKTPSMVEMFAGVAAFLKERGFVALNYKTVPHIYHQLPAEEDRYALFLAGATVTRRGLLTVVTSKGRPAAQDRRVRGARKAVEHGLRVTRSMDFPTYWALLTDRLQRSHGTRPVHTLHEIQALQSGFPQNIKLFACFTPDGEMVAGVVLYESSLVAHCQYVAASDRGLDLQALDLLFMDLLTTEYAAKPFFDFGTSDENDGWCLKRGLVDQKEGFGARAIAHDHYLVNLSQCEPDRLRRALA